MKNYQMIKMTSLYIVASVFLIVSLTSYFTTDQVSWALEPPKRGEIEELRKAKRLDNRLDFVLRLGNHKIDSYLLQKSINKVQRTYMKLKGKDDAEIDMLAPEKAPPPGRQGMPSTGNVKILAILIEFQDHIHTNTQNFIHDNLYGTGDATRSPYDSLAVYYDRASYNQLDLSSGSTLGWYQTSNNRPIDPGGWSARLTIVRDLIKEVLNHYDAQGHNFAQYDNNNDGTIDYFIVIWTGPPGGWATLWWGWQTSFGDNTYTVDGKTLGKFSWQWEASPVGSVFSPVVVIHETGHALGLPDYYDYDGAVGPDGGVGGLDIMDGNKGDHNCFSKWVLDWLTPSFSFSGTQIKTLNASGNSKDCVFIWPGTSADMFSEFFLVQNRHRVENDDAAGMPSDGMLIWHVDATLNAAGTDFLYDNSFTTHKLLRLMEADGLEEIESGQSADAGDYYKPNKTFGPCSTPSSRRYDNTHTRVKVSEFSIPGPSMSAKFEHGASTTCEEPPDGGWFSAYKKASLSFSDLALLRKYRDTVLMNTNSGRIYTKMLYANSGDALNVLLNNPDLAAAAGDIIKSNIDAVERSLRGNDGVISNTDKIIDFIDAFGEESPKPLKELTQLVKAELIEKLRNGQKFFGFELRDRQKAVRDEKMLNSQRFSVLVLSGHQEVAF